VTKAIHTYLARLSTYLFTLAFEWRRLSSSLHSQTWNDEGGSWRHLRIPRTTDFFLPERRTLSTKYSWSPLRLFKNIIIVLRWHTDFSTWWPSFLCRSPRRCKYPPRKGLLYCAFCTSSWYELWSAWVQSSTTRLRSVFLTGFPWSRPSPEQS